MPLRFVLAVSAALSAAPAIADNSGSYLAARSAIFSNDFSEAAKYYGRALNRDAGNPALLENAATAYLAKGDIDRAATMSRRLMQRGANSQVAALVLFGDQARNDQWAKTIEDLDAGMTVGPLFDALLRAWALVGEGQMSEALAAFDEVSTGVGIAAFGNYHKALALSSVGDFEGAAELFESEAGATMRMTRRGLIAYLEVLSQLERGDEALALLDESFGATLDPSMQAMRDTLAGGQTLTVTAARSAQDGIAEIYFSIASALQAEAQPSYTLLYSRMAMALREDHIDSLLLTAELLEDLEQFELATEVYDLVPREDPAFHEAELGRAEALRQDGREDAAIEVLQQLTESHGDLPSVHITLGDTLRGLERYEESLAPYNNAVELIGTPEEQHWLLYFARAISHERLGDWPKAEADFRKSLELRPEQPQVMNYLGYSFLEMKTNYDEALDLIERAVALRPDSGYIIDSLGWGLYRLGRYEEAVGHMERAVELMPVDPIVNDHLGDVYWAVGRYREAEFQWHRALSFITEDTNTNDVDPDRIRRKLEVGLDKILEEEGAPPLEVAQD